MNCFGQTFSTVVTAAILASLFPPTIRADENSGAPEELKRFVIPDSPPAFKMIAEAAARDPNRNKPREPTVFDPMKGDNLQQVVRMVHLQHIDVDPSFDLESLIVEIVPERASLIADLFQRRRTAQHSNSAIDVNALQLVPEKRSEILRAIHRQEYKRSVILSRSLSDLLSAEQKRMLVGRIVRYFGPRSLTHPLVQGELQIGTAQRETISDLVDILQSTFRRIGPSAAKKPPGRDEVREAFENVTDGLEPIQLKKYLFLHGQIHSMDQVPTAIKGGYSVETKEKLLSRLQANIEKDEGGVFDP